MTREQIKAEVLAYIKEHPGTSYVEIEQVFDRCGFDWKGELESYAGANEAIVFWVGWNIEAFKIIDELMREKLIDRDPCQALIYLVDGKAPNYPQLRGRPEKVKRPHWLPCTFKAIANGKE